MHIEYFEVSDSGTIKIRDFSPPEERQEVYGVYFDDVKTKSGLFDAIETCPPLLSAIHEIYLHHRDELENDLLAAREMGTLAPGSFIEKLEAKLLKMPDEPWGNAKKWAVQLSNDQFNRHVLEPLRPWFTEEPDSVGEEDYIPNSATAWGCAIDYFEMEDSEDLDAVGVYIVEGECPGSTYYAAELQKDVETANAIAKQRELSFRFVKEEG